MAKSTSASKAEVAAPSHDLSTIIQELRQQLAYAQQQSQYYQAQAEKIQTALTVLEQTLQGAAPAPVSAQTQPKQASQSRQKVLNQKAVEQNQSSLNGSAEPAPSTSPTPDPEPAPAETAKRTPKPKTSKPDTFSLRNHLLARHQRRGLEQSVLALLQESLDPLSIPQLVDALYGANLKRDFRPRAVGMLTRYLNNGAKQGLWSAADPIDGKAAYQTGSSSPS
jgi:type II secretory pathway component PulJ